MTIVGDSVQSKSAGTRTAGWRDSALATLMIWAACSTEVFAQTSATRAYLQSNFLAQGTSGNVVVQALVEPSFVAGLGSDVIIDLQDSMAAHAVLQPSGCVRRGQVTRCRSTDGRLTATAVPAASTSPAVYRLRVRRTHLGWTETGLREPTGPLRVTLQNAASTNTTVLSRCRSGGRMALLCEPSGAQSAVTFSFLPPLVATPQGDPADFDGTLKRLITVTICRPTASSCEVLARRDATSTEPALRLVQDHYHTSWSPPPASIGTPVRIQVDVAGKVLGSIDITAPPHALAINFRIYSDASTRAHALHALGHDATSIATVLASEFPISFTEIGEILRSENFTFSEIAAAVVGGLSLTALQTAQMMKALGSPARDTGDALRTNFGLFAPDAAALLKDVGYNATEITDALLSSFLRTAAASAVILKALGFDSVEVADALSAVYLRTYSDTASDLRSAGYTEIAIGQALKDSFGLDAATTAGLFYTQGVNAEATADVLKVVFGITNVSDLETALIAAGYDESSILAITQYDKVSAFAPQLRFDRAATTFPMSAQDYFDYMLCGQQGGPPPLPGDQYDYALCDHHCVGGDKTGDHCVGGAGNVSSDLSCDCSSDPGNCTAANAGVCSLVDYNPSSLGKLQQGTVPTYFKIAKCGNQLRINYWWFYGVQLDELGCFGEQKHRSDWEHITVTLSEDRTRVAAITFFQHNGQYTRVVGRDGFETVGNRPVIYVGKTAHGSYHDSGGNGTCAYYGDFRNPSGPGDYWLTNNDLVSMTGTAENWIVGDSTAKWAWGGSDGIYTHPAQGGPSCSLDACVGVNIVLPVKDAGCYASQCPSNYTDCGTFCTSGCSVACLDPAGVDNDVIFYNYTVSTSDNGLTNVRTDCD